jgi:uncharacterized protein
MSWFRHDEKRDVLVLRLHIQPNARSNSICGLHGDALKVRISAPAVDDKANRMLTDFIGEILDLPANRVIIARGLHSRNKTLEISQPGADVLSRLAANFA